MKKLILVLLSTLLLTGCTVVRIDTGNIDNIINVVLSKNNKLYNQTGKGYKYYLPQGTINIDTSEYNEKLYARGNYYYLYVDINSFYYKTEFEYKENKEAYYSRYLDINGKKGYLEINEVDGLYLIEFTYNYAKIEALVEEASINSVVLDASYILSTMKYNTDVIKIVLNEDYFTNKDVVYDIFTPKKQSSDALEYDEEEAK